MSVANLGDLSQSYSMRQRNVALRQDMDRLTAELATGQVTDLREVLAGNHSYLTEIERRTTILNGYNVATSEAKIFAETSQRALGNIQEFGADLSLNLITASTSLTGPIIADAGAEARNALTSIFGAVNTSAAGRHLFSGNATDRPPLPESADLLAALRPVVAGAATPDDVLAAATAWFDDPAGFDAMIYQGATVGMGPFSLSQTDEAALDVRADDPKLKETLKLTAVAALADDAVLGFDFSQQAELFGKVGEAMLAAQDQVISLRANVGFAEARIEGIAARNAAELTSMEFAKAELLAVDPFDAATRLEKVQFQLQSLYSVTVRNAQLSLVNFL